MRVSDVRAATGEYSEALAGAHRDAQSLKFATAISRDPLLPMSESLVRRVLQNGTGSHGSDQKRNKLPAADFNVCLIG